MREKKREREDDIGAFLGVIYSLKLSSGTKPE